jgi:hypothetical protein
MLSAGNKDKALAAALEDPPMASKETAAKVCCPLLAPVPLDSHAASTHASFFFSQIRKPTLAPSSVSSLHLRRTRLRMPCQS